jgi:hypothetical protein
MKVFYQSPIGLEVNQLEGDKDFTITGNAKKSMTVKEFDSAYDFEEFIQEKIDCSGISFDSEYCQFFAYAKTKAQAIKFVNAIENHFSRVREMLTAK